MRVAALVVSLLFFPVLTLAGTLTAIGPLPYDASLPQPRDWDFMRRDSTSKPDSTAKRPSLLPMRRAQDLIRVLAPQGGARLQTTACEGDSARPMDTVFLISAFTTLFVVIDPIGLTPIFIALTQGMTPQQRRAIALRASVIALLLLTLFAFFGEAVLGFAGISMPAFRIAGGILLFLTALDMLFEHRTKRREGQAEEDEGPDPSVFPLAIPLIAGPGAIATMILLAGQADGALEMAAVLLVMTGVLLLAFLLFLTAGITERALGRTGINVVTRLLGMLLAALSVQFVLDGLRTFGLAPA